MSAKKYIGVNGFVLKRINNFMEAKELVSIPLNQTGMGLVFKDN